MNAESTIALVLKNGTQLTSACILTVPKVEAAYHEARLDVPNADLRFEDHEGRIIIVDTNEIALFTVGKYETEEQIAERLKQKAQPRGEQPNRSGIIKLR